MGAMLEPARIHSPELPGLTWVNGTGPRRLADLTGSAVLLEFLELTCLSCLRVLPYLRQWHARYAPYGLEILGIHTPQFAFGRQAAYVAQAARRLGLRWPIALDNDQGLWTGHAVNAWPTSVLIDPAGYIRLKHIGESDYTQTEAGIRQLLSEAGNWPNEALPLTDLAAEHRPGARCYPVTPELHAESLGNPAAAGDVYLPPPDRRPGSYYLEGRWQVLDQVAISQDAGARIYLPYQAADVYAVLDDLAAGAGPLEVRLRQSGQPLPPANFGADVALHRDQAVLRLDGPRLYHLVKRAAPAAAELVLEADNPAMALYAFTFGSCSLPTEPVA